MADLPLFTANSSPQDEENSLESDQATRLANLSKQNDLTQQVGANQAEQAYLSQLYSNQAQVGGAKAAAQQGYVNQPVQPAPQDMTTGSTTPASLTATTSPATYTPPQTQLAHQAPVNLAPAAQVAAASPPTTPTGGIDWGQLKSNLNAQSSDNTPALPLPGGNAPISYAPDGTVIRAPQSFSSSAAINPTAQAYIGNAAAPAGTPPIQTPGGNPSGSPPTAPQQQLVQATPFDNNQFMQQLTAKLANTPGAAQELMRIKEQRDTQLGNIFQMAANGGSDEAAYLAQQQGFNIPDAVMKDGNITQGMNLAQKAYPDEPDKGQTFFKAFINTPGTIDDKVNAGTSAAGSPSGLAQRELYKAMSLAKYVPFVGNGGQLNIVDETTGQATPVTNSATGAGVNVIGGKGVHLSNAAITQGTGQFRAVPGVGLVRTDPTTGTASVVVPIGGNAQQNVLKIYQEIDKDPNSINLTPEQKMTKAQQVYQTMVTPAPAAPSLSTQFAAPASPAAPAATPAAPAPAAPSAVPATQQAVPAPVPSAVAPAAAPSSDAPGQPFTTSGAAFPANNPYNALQQPMVATQNGAMSPNNPNAQLPVQIPNTAEGQQMYNNLPRGSAYVGPSGVQRIKP